MRVRGTAVGGFCREWSFLLDAGWRIAFFWRAIVMGSDGKSRRWVEAGGGRGKKKRERKRCGNRELRRWPFDFAKVLIVRIAFVNVPL